MCQLGAGPARAQGGNGRLQVGEQQRGARRLGAVVFAAGYRQWSIDDGTADGHQAIGVGRGRDNDDLDGGGRRCVGRNGGNAFPLGRRRKRRAQAQHLGLCAASRGIKGQMRPNKPATGNDHDSEACQTRPYESGREAADGIGCRRSRGLFRLC